MNNITGAAKKKLEEVKHTYDTLAVPILAADKNYNIVYSNPAAREALGFSEKELAASSLMQLNIYSELLGNVLNKKENQTLNTPARGKKGDFSAKALFSCLVPGELLSVSFVPMTAEDKGSTDERAFLDTFLGRAPLSVYVRTLKGNLVFWNKKTEEIFGSDPSVFYSVSSEEERDFYIQREKDIVDKGQTVTVESEIYTTAQNERKDLRITKVPLKREGYEPMVLSIIEDITAAKQKEKERHEFKSLLEQVLEQAPIAIYTMDLNNNVLFTNKKFNQMGFPITEDDPKLEAFYRSRDKEIVDQRRVVSIPEEQYTMPDGSVVTSKMTKAPIFDENGQPLMLLTLIEDITNQKRQERALVESRNLLQKILEKAPLCIYALDLEGNVLFANTLASSYFNITPNHKPLPKDEKEFFYRQRDLRTVLEKKVIDIPEEEFITDDGRSITLHLIKVPIYDDQSNPLMVLTVAEDITDKKRHEMEVIETKNFLQTVLDNLPVALSARKASGEYTLWNKKSEELFGAKSIDVIGSTSYRSDTNKEQKEYLEMQDKMVFESGTEYKIPQELISTAREGVKIMQTVKTPVYTAEGIPDYILSVSEDITKNVKIEKQMRESREKYSILVEEAREGIMIIEDGKVIFANKKMHSLSPGRPEGDLGKIPFEELFTQTVRKTVAEKHDLVLNDISPEETFPASILLHPAEDDLPEEGKEVEVTFSPARYLGHKIVLCFINDISRYAILLEKFKKDNLLFTSAFERYKEPLFIMNNGFKIQNINSQARDMFSLTGADTAALRGFYIKPLLPLDARRLAEKGQPLQTRIQLRPSMFPEPFASRKGLNAERFLSLHFMPVRNETNDYLVSIAEETQKAAPQQQDSAGGKDILLLNQALAFCSPDGSMQNISLKLCALAGMTEQELRGKQLHILFNEAEKGALEREIKELYKTGSIQHRRHLLKTAQGIELPVEINAAKTQEHHFIVHIEATAPKRQILELLDKLTDLNRVMADSPHNALIVCSAGQKSKHSFILEANKKASEELGYTLPELLDKPVSMLFDKPHSLNMGTFEKILKEKAERLDAGKPARFTANVYTKKGAALVSEIVLQKMQAPDRMLVSVLNITPLIRMSTKNTPEFKELSSLKQSLPGILVTMDIEGVIQDINGNMQALSLDAKPEEFLGKAPFEFLPLDVNDNVMMALKEALSVNIATETSFTVNTKNGQKSFHILFSPVIEEQKVIALVKEITNEKEIEHKIKKLYDISGKSSPGLTEHVNDILDFGKHIFGASAGIVIRFNPGSMSKFNVVYAAPNDLLLKKGMVFNTDKYIDKVKNEDTALIEGIDPLTLESGSLLKDKNIKSALIAPLFLGGQISGALCFLISKESPASFKPTDEDLMGLMTRILSLSIELRQADKIIDDNAEQLQRALRYLSIPSLIINPAGDMTFVNPSLAEMFEYGEDDLKGKNFFKTLCDTPTFAKKAFMGEFEESKEKTFTCRLKMVDKGGNIGTVEWKAHALKNKKDKVSGFALIAPQKKKK